MDSDKRRGFVLRLFTGQWPPIGLALDFAGLNAARMLFWSAVLNGLLAPPLVIMVVLLTSDRRVMGHRVNSRGMQALGWICALIMSSAAIALLAFLR